MVSAVSALLFYFFSLDKAEQDASRHLEVYSGERARQVLARFDAVGLELAILHASGGIGRHIHNHSAHLVEGSSCVAASEAADALGVDFSDLLSAPGEAVSPVDGAAVFVTTQALDMGGLRLLATWRLDEIHAQTARFVVFNAFLIGVSLLTLIILVTLVTRRLTRPPSVCLATAGNHLGQAIAKPFAPMTLADRIKEFWERRHG